MKKQLVLLLCSLLAFLAVTTAQPSPPSVGALGPIQFLPTYADVRIISPVNSGDYSNPIHLIFTIEVTGLERSIWQCGN